MRIAVLLFVAVILAGLIFVSAAGPQIKQTKADIVAEVRSELEVEQEVQPTLELPDQFVETAIPQVESESLIETSIYDEIIMDDEFFRTLGELSLSDDSAQLMYLEETHFEEITDEEVDELIRKIESGEAFFQTWDIDLNPSQADANAILVPAVKFSADELGHLLTFLGQLGDAKMAADQLVVKFTHFTNHGPDVGIAMRQIGKMAAHISNIINAALSGNGAILRRVNIPGAQNATMFIAKVRQGYMAVLVADNGSPITSYLTNRAWGKYQQAMMKAGWKLITANEVPQAVTANWYNKVPHSIKILLWSLRYIAISEGISFARVWAGVATGGTTEIILMYAPSCLTEDGACIYQKKEG